MPAIKRLGKAKSRVDLCRAQRRNLEGIMEVAVTRACAQYVPMEARLVSDLPREPGWQFEPKWDGFRCLAFHGGDEIEL